MNKQLKKKIIWYIAIVLLLSLIVGVVFFIYNGIDPECASIPEDVGPCGVIANLLFYYIWSLLYVFVASLPFVLIIFFFSLVIKYFKKQS